MMQQQNFIMCSGDTRTLTVTVNDRVTGDPIDLTGASIAWVLAKNNKSTAEIEKSVGSGITVATPASGVFVVTINPADTTDLDGIYYHEAQVTDASGRVVTVMRGRATIETDLA